MNENQKEKVVGEIMKECTRHAMKIVEIADKYGCDRNELFEMAVHAHASLAKRYDFKKEDLKIWDF